MKHVILILSICFSWQLSVRACSCAFVPTFCETITYPGYVDSNYLIVHGRVESKMGEFMEVKIIDVLFGTPKETTLTIENGYGADCRESISRFEVNRHYLFALYGSSYFLSICGITWLPISNGKIHGSIAPGVSQLRLNEFPSLQNCGNIGAVLTFITVQPTLTSDHIEIATTKDLDNIQIVVHDMMGRLVYEAPSARLLESEPLIIPAALLTSGCYAITIHYAGLRRTHKVVVVT